MQHRFKSYQCSVLSKPSLPTYIFVFNWFILAVNVNLGLTVQTVNSTSTTALPIHAKMAPPVWIASTHTSASAYLVTKALTVKKISMSVCQHLVLMVVYAMIGLGSIGAIVMRNFLEVSDISTRAENNWRQLPSLPLSVALVPLILATYFPTLSHVIALVP